MENFLTYGSEIFILIKKTESLIKLFKVCGFLRQRLKSRSAERETLFVLQAGDAPSTAWKE